MIAERLAPLLSSCKDLHYSVFGTFPTIRRENECEWRQDLNLLAFCVVSLDWSIVRGANPHNASVYPQFLSESIAGVDCVWLPVRYTMTLVSRSLRCTLRRLSW
jgi:hypothetical protein